MELRAPGIETTTRQGWSSRRRQRGAPPCAARSWGVGMGLLRHDGEDVFVEDDAVLVLGIRGRARYAQAHVPKRRSHHRVPRMPYRLPFYDSSLEAVANPNRSAAVGNNKTSIISLQ